MKNLKFIGDKSNKKTVVFTDNQGGNVNIVREVIKKNLEPEFYNDSTKHDIDSMINDDYLATERLMDKIYKSFIENRLKLFFTGEIECPEPERSIFAQRYFGSYETLNRNIAYTYAKWINVIMTHYGEKKYTEKISPILSQLTDNFKDILLSKGQNEWIQIIDEKLNPSSPIFGGLTSWPILVLIGVFLIKKS